MNEIRDWKKNRDMWVKVLESKTSRSLDEWNKRIQRLAPRDEAQLRSWLEDQGVTGYARALLVMERFGYPDFLLATAAELIDRQYTGRPQLRAVYDAIVKAATKMGDVAIQARKGYVSLVSPRRTFARIRATNKTRIDLGLRLEGAKPGGRLQRSNLHETMRVQIALTRPEEVDGEVRGLLRRAYAQNS